MMITVQDNRLINSLTFYAATFTVLVGIGMVSSAQASMLNKSAFVDNFDDGVVNTSVYSSIGSASINESNGIMTVAASANEGVSINFDSVLPKSNWIGLKFDTIDFSSSQGFNINIREKNLLGQEFISLSINVEPVISSDQNILLNGIKKDLKFVYTIYDEDGNPIKMDMYLWEKALEVPANGMWTFFLDWQEKDGKDEWIIDLESPDVPEELRKVILKSTKPLAREKGSKFVDITVTSGNDPTFAFDTIAANPVARHTPEPTSAISLLAFGTLGITLILKRIKKQEKEAAKVS